MYDVLLYYTKLYYILYYMCKMKGFVVEVPKYVYPPWQTLRSSASIGNKHTQHMIYYTKVNIILYYITYYILLYIIIFTIIITIIISLLSLLQFLLLYHYYYYNYFNNNIIIFSQIILLDVISIEMSLYLGLITVLFFFFSWISRQHFPINRYL